MKNQYTIAKQLQPFLRKNDFAHCETVIYDTLSHDPNSPFNFAMQSHFNNDPKTVAASFDQFFEREQKKYKIAAAYAEMNGFNINPDRWYFDLFAYKLFGGHDDYDWLSEWDSDDAGHITLTGMEKLQHVYQTENLSNTNAGIASLLVLVRFQQLIHAAIPFMKNKNFPILVTAHDYEFMYEG